MDNCMKLNFKIDGVIYQTVSVEKGEPVMAIDAPEREGYHFVGWKDLPAKCIPGKEIDVEAVFEKVCYRLLFVAGEETIAQQNVPFGEPITPPELEGDATWIDLPETMPATDLTVYASLKPITYSFTMLVDDEVFGSYEFPAGADLSGLPVPECAGYDFSGWNKNYKKMPRSNLTVRGRFKPHRHTLSFVIEGEMEFTKKMDFGQKIRPIGAPTRPCYTFSGWGEIPETMPDHDLVFTGKFEINTHVLRFILDGRLIYESTLDVGTPIKAPETPQREGYMFSGWRGLPKTMPDEDYTAEGRYYLRKFKIVYMLDGEEYGRDTLAFGAPITALPAPEKEGMHFSGWSEIPVTMPAEDLVVSGSFSE